MKTPRVLTLSASAAPTPWLSMPDSAEVFSDPDAIPDNLLRPLLKVDGGAIRPEWAGLPICVIAHEVGISDLTFAVEADGKYTPRAYGSIDLPTPGEVRARLDAYIDEECDGPDGIEDENAELFEEDEARTYLDVDEDDDEVTVEVGCSTWLQGRGGQPGEGDDGFALALCAHPLLFGRYYVFVDLAERTVTQVFECT